MTSIHPSSGSSNMCLLQLMINVLWYTESLSITKCNNNNLYLLLRIKCWGWRWCLYEDVSVPSMTRYTGKWRPRRVACHIRMIYGRGRGGWAAHSAPHSFPCMHYELCFQNRHTRIGDKMRSHHLQCRKQRRSSSSCFTSSWLWWENVGELR